MTDLGGDRNLGNVAMAVEARPFKIITLAPTRLVLNITYPEALILHHPHLVHTYAFGPPTPTSGIVSKPQKRAAQRALTSSDMAAPRFGMSEAPAPSSRHMSFSTCHRKLSRSLSLIRGYGRLSDLGHGIVNQMFQAAFASL
ncbi:hypothetical protein PM082_002315 [Marasmius tenuissimus]|nr:hypothetical protein PM082_002315 [Marasmius tenuissimus]